jgi:hypothetical protein
MKQTLSRIRWFSVTAVVMTLVSLGTAQDVLWEAALHGTQNQRLSQPSAPAPAVSFAFGTVDMPRFDAQQVARAVDDKGRIVGIFNGNTFPAGYYLIGGTFKTIVYPDPNTTSTVPFGTNSSGSIVGSYSTDSGATYHGFLLSRNVYSTVDFPSATYTALTGINKSGTIVGRYSSAPPAYHGFMLKNGLITAIDVPSATATSVFSINRLEVVAGTYQAQDGTFHGFTYQNGTFTGIDYPGATITNVSGINDSGQIVGSYSNDGGAHYHSFLLQGGAFTSFDVPFISGLHHTFAQGISNHGDIVGSYYDNSGSHFGFWAHFH